MSSTSPDAHGPDDATAADGEVLRTYLELTDRDALRPADFPESATVRVTPCAPCTVARYRALYEAVGRAYRWRDRLAWSDERLAEWLERPTVAVRVLERRDATDPDRWAPVGYYELARHPDGAVELVYFGLVREAQGAGLGRALLTHAVREAWAMGAGRVWLHTCTLDGPTALPNYLARGFRVTGTERYTVPSCGDEPQACHWQDPRAARRSITLQLYYRLPGRMTGEFAAIVRERALERGASRIARLL